MVTHVEIHLSIYAEGRLAPFPEHRGPAVKHRPQASRLTWPSSRRGPVRLSKGSGQRGSTQRRARSRGGRQEGSWRRLTPPRDNPPSRPLDRANPSQRPRFTRIPRTNSIAPCPSPDSRSRPCHALPGRGHSWHMVPGARDNATLCIARYVADSWVLQAPGPSGGPGLSQGLGSATEGLVMPAALDNYRTIYRHALQEAPAFSTSSEDVRKLLITCSGHRASTQIRQPRPNFG